MPATLTEPPYFDLGPTPSYRRRRAGWFPGRGEHPDHRVGTVRIVLEKAGRSGEGTEVDEYGVQEEHAEGVKPGARSFLLLNDTDADQPDVYRVVLGPGWSECTCQAGSCLRECKHTAALVAVVTGGGL